MRSAQLGIIEIAPDCADHHVVGADRDDAPSFTLDDRPGDASHGSAHGRYAGRLRLDQSHRRALVIRGLDHHVAGEVHVRHVAAKPCPDESLRQRPRRR